MNFDDVFNVCRARGVRLVIQGGQLRAQGRKGAINDALKDGLAEHKQAIMELLGDGVFPDSTLPAVLHIAAAVPNTVEALGACIDAQRVKAA